MRHWRGTACQHGSQAGKQARRPSLGVFTLFSLLFATEAGYTPVHVIVFERCAG